MPDLMQHANLTLRQAVKGELKVNLAEKEWVQLARIAREETRRKIFGGIGAVFLLALLLKIEVGTLPVLASMGLGAAFFLYLSLRKRK